ncbi:MAG TPA: low affinity iron permease family protein [Usitatibacter sp.]|nr:low affinity iron permease family protein [Usitatibacter sp.]
MARRLVALGGHSGTLFAAMGLVVMWLVTDPGFRYSDTWQLVIATATSVIALVIVFLIQSTQDRDLAGARNQEIVKGGDRATVAEETGRAGADALAQ